MSFALQNEGKLQNIREKLPYDYNANIVFQHTALELLGMFLTFLPKAYRSSTFYSNTARPVIANDHLCEIRVVLES